MAGRSPISSPLRVVLIALALVCGSLGSAPANLPLRVACFNVEDGLYATNTASYQDTATILKRINADVVGLCELMVNDRFKPASVNDDVNFPVLATELGLTHRVFDTNNTDHRAGIASRYPIAQTIWVFGSGMTRRIPLARIEVPGTQQRVWAAMMHLRARHTDGSEQHRRAAELFWLRQAVLANCDVKKDTILLMGDFNLVSPVDEVFTSASYSGVTYPLFAWKDADRYFVPEQIFKIDARHAGNGGESYTWFSTNPTNQFAPSALDHIMVSASVRSLGVASEIYDVGKDVAGVQGLVKYGAPPLSANYGSDHLPIFADIKVPVKAAEPFVRFALPESGMKYANGSSYYFNATVRSDVPNSELRVYVNGLSLDPASVRRSNVIAFPRSAVGLRTEFVIEHVNNGVIVDSASMQTGYFSPLHPLPSVEMLSPGPQAAGLALLRARAFFPPKAGTNARVCFYADGVYLGEGRPVGADIYEFAVRTADVPSSALITARASAIQFLSTIDYGSYHGSAISPNHVTLPGVAQNDVSLAAGRTKFEVAAKNLDWPDAHADAIASGGRLAVFPTGAMYDRVIGKIRQTYAESLWIGLADAEEEGTWRWIDESLLGENRWHPGEPNNFNGAEDYAHVWGWAQTWNDGGDGSLPAHLLEKFPLATAALPFTAGGVPWTVDTSDSTDDKDSARAMTSHSQSSWREYTVSGPAEVRFDWKVSSQQGDAFSYAVNGTTAKSISGETAWSSESVILPGGVHTIRWTYTKNASGSAGANAGFLDSLEVNALPSIEFTRGVPGYYTAGSSVFVNARLGTNAVSGQFYLNGAALGEPGIGDAKWGNTISARVEYGDEGTYIFRALATGADGFVGMAPDQTSRALPPRNPLPWVSMLPVSAPSPEVHAGSLILLQAEAAFPAAEGTVEFYANGIYIGTARKNSQERYELPWQTPSDPVNVSITAQVVALDHTDEATGTPCYGATISANLETVATSLPDEVTLAAGRTKFEVVAKNLTWPEAHADAIRSGGRLAVFPTGAMYDQVIGPLRQLYGDALWIGLTDELQEGVWRWIDGTLLSDSRWNTDEPNDWNGNEDHAHVWWGTTAWNDNSGAMPAYILEKRPYGNASFPAASDGEPWQIDSADATDAKDSAKAVTSHGGSSWREYSFTGPAEVRFQWKVSSETGDVFSYAVNGTTVKSISGETAWSAEKVRLPAGTHTIRWTYTKDASGSAGADAGFLDALEVFSVQPATPGVTLQGTDATFCVWAPNATAVSVVGDFNGWTESPLSRDEANGHWSGTLAGVSHGDEYQYLIRWPGNESGRLKNDPRTDWVRDGKSVIYDHGAFDWGAGFVPRGDQAGLVYELHIGAFNNPSPKTKTVATFDDAILRLDYLQQLGVDIIALMPVAEYETATSWGYNPAYLFAVENDYGGPDGLKRFVKAAHARGMRVQLDIVHNHYLQGDYPANGPGLLDFDGPQDIYFYGQRDPLAGDPDQPKRAATYWGPRPDFSRPEVRRYVEDNVQHWLENYRIDGFRWDSPKNILGYDADGQSAEPDTLLPEAKDMMARINRMIREDYPGRWSIAEEPNLLVAGTPGGGQFYLDAAVTNPAESFHGHWQYAFHDSVANNMRTGSPAVSAMLGRVMNSSEPPATRVIFTDTHDLAGDLNKGLRWPHRLGEADPDNTAARRKSLLGAVITLTAPGSPMLLMGQEFHATGSFTDRRPLDWSKAAANHQLFRLYRDLAQLRRDSASVRSTALSSSYGANDTLRTGRYWRGNEVVVAFNMSAQHVVETPFTFPSGGIWHVRINTDATIYDTDFGDFGPAGGMVNVTAADNRAPISIAPYSAIVFTRTPPNAASEDTDNDGLPDSWEAISGATEPDADDDGDGLTNLQEFLSGLDPKTFNPDAVAGSFNYWDPVASPLTTAMADATRRGHMRYFTQETSGSFRWIIGGIFYGIDPATGLLAAGGQTVTFAAPANTYIYFAAAAGLSTAEAIAINPAQPLDADNNQLDDRWQTHYGVAIASSDEDGDGLANITEFERGSNPLVPDRAPAVVGNLSPLQWAPDDPGLRMKWSEKRQRWEWSGNFSGGPIEFKFAMGPGWSGENHGVGGMHGRTDPSGGPEANIPETLSGPGRYRFSFNELARTYSLEPFPRRAEWRETHELDEAGDWTADTDMDGASDLLEYALGGNPRRPDTQPLGPGLAALPGAKAVRNTSAGFTFSWIENADPDVVVTPEISAELGAGAWSEAPSETAPDQNNVPLGHVRKMVHLPSTGQKMFLRLRASVP